MGHICGAGVPPAHQPYKSFQQLEKFVSRQTSLTNDPSQSADRNVFSFWDYHQSWRIASKDHRPVTYLSATRRIFRGPESTPTSQRRDSVPQKLCQSQVRFETDGFADFERREFGVLGIQNEIRFVRHDDAGDLEDAGSQGVDPFISYSL